MVISMMAGGEEIATVSAHGGVKPDIKVNILFLDGHVKMHNCDADWGSEVLLHPAP